MEGHKGDPSFLKRKEVGVPFWPLGKPLGQNQSAAYNRAFTSATTSLLVLLVFPESWIVGENNIDSFPYYT